MTPRRPATEPTIGSRFADAYWLAALPAVLTVVGYWTGRTVGFGLAVPGETAVDTAIAWSVVGGYVALGTIGTAWIVYDATTLARMDADWQPNPLSYCCGYGFVLAAAYYKIRVGPLVEAPETPLLTVTVLVGGILVSSVGSGPVYLVNRHHYLGDAGAHREATHGD